MSINIFLSDEIGYGKYQDYSFYNYGMRQFLQSKMDFVDRQEYAIDLIDGIITDHGKKGILKYIVELARVEQGIQELQPRLRDHVVHALLCYVLGAYINENFLKPQGNNVNEFQWKIACLFHDVGYPAQVAKDILKHFSGTVNTISKEIGVPTYEVYFKTVPVNLEKLTNNQNSFDLMQKELDSWGLQFNAKKEYQNLINSGGICHGMISALSVLRIIDLLYQKNNPKRKFKKTPVAGIDWDQRWFVDDIVPSCSAIFCHNLPSKCFEKGKIDRNKAPLAFLLKITDCLQEWERPSKENTDGFLSTDFSIKIEKNKLLLSAKIPDERKTKINAEIQDIVIASDIKVQ